MTTPNTTILSRYEIIRFLCAVSSMYEISQRGWEKDERPQWPEGWKFSTRRQDNRYSYQEAQLVTVKMGTLAVHVYLPNNHGRDFLPKDFEAVTKKPIRSRELYRQQLMDIVRGKSLYPSNQRTYNNVQYHARYYNDPWREATNLSRETVIHAATQNNLPTSDTPYIYALTRISPKVVTEQTTRRVGFWRRKITETNTYTTERSEPIENGLTTEGMWWAYLREQLPEFFGLEKLGNQQWAALVTSREREARAKRQRERDEIEYKKRVKNAPINAAFEVDMKLE